ncbi:GH12 family glycosyl hydrolase domain-containing protein [Cellulomonas sp. NS3]|uniref:GH12 family glycosyl hydrolase domain-containing protein n=1 Tax=Cellulomonas sp. NS3 TaxID=2973977 RepID=UPI0021611A33|nr:cellulose binding domain-containing protein [Cellulomonas sp. NS3]
MRSLRTTFLTGPLSLGLGVSALVAAAPATAAVICEQYGSAPIQNGRYIVGNNRWGSSATQCIDTTATGFRVTQADGSNPTNGSPKSYPTVYYGCHYGVCSTSGNILTNGLQASDPAFAGISTSVSMSYPSSGTYNAAYDIWFHQSRPTSTTGQNNGAELMIWLNRQGSIQPIGSRVGTANLNGATWEVWSGNIGWNVISYVRTTPTTSLSFNVKTFWDDVVSRGLGSSAWWLTSIQAGFEPWIGGTGLAVNNFSVTTGGSTPPPTTPPPTTPPPTTPPPTGAGACTATYSTVNSWQGGSQGSVTVRSSGSSAISGWTVTWTYPNGQTISSLWNGRLTQSGSNETVRNESYNGSLAPNASTTFGFQVSGASPGTPTLRCTAT